MATNLLGNGIDPLAGYRQTMETARRVMDPMAEVRRFREPTKLVDPLAGYRQTMETARRVMDPMGEYRRIMSDFSKLVGAPPPSPEEEAVTNAPSPDSPTLTPFSPALIVALLSVAWTCGWLIARGADTQAFGDLLFEAAGLAAYLYEQSKQDRN
jgi:hypothetical protein